MSLFPLKATHKPVKAYYEALAVFHKHGARSIVFGWGHRMTDHVSRAKRSVMMSLVRSKHTKPELAVRRLVHSLGYRYRLHDATLPGTPDLVFPCRHKIVFVHGCFWHRHAGCRYATCPRTRVRFWTEKFRSNVERDRRTRRELRSLGWEVLIVWQCQLKNPKRLEARIDEFLAG